MQVGVGKAGQDASAVQVQDLGAWSRGRMRAGFVTDVDEAAIANCDGTGARNVGIHRVEAAVDEEKVGTHAAEELSRGYSAFS